MTYRITFIGILFFSVLTVFGQHSGNSVIEQNYSYNQTQGQSVNKLYLSDSSFVVQAKVLTNVIADSYVITIGVSEYAKTLKEANSKIDDRIQKFTSALKSKFNISASDIYVDMTTQTQVADYKVDGNYAEQFISGFEQKKNVIVKLKNIKDLDKIVILASEYEIYDLAKVDYIVTDLNKIYTQLFQTAMKVINGKKDLYVKATNVKLKTASQIYGETFYSFVPAQLYKNYTPNITTEYYNSGSYSKRKDLKKNTTYYYDHINYSGFDKVIHPIVTEPTVEYVLILHIKFDIDK
ncbi:MAG TPA: SIMPL domain-containing protein [Edaphocola sp.]|nr:SIMPL domain-containing protein [Edaphocola sp.]